MLNIKEILPHRYPFLLVDRVSEIDIKDKAFVRATVGGKTVCEAEILFAIG